MQTYPPEEEALTKADENCFAERRLQFNKVPKQQTKHITKSTGRRQAKIQTHRIHGETKDPKTYL